MLVLVLEVVLGLRLGFGFCPLPSTTLNVSEIGPPQLYHIVPSSGPPGGGVNISVYGDGFFPYPDLSCLFGSTSVPAVFINSSMISCLAPSGVDTVEFFSTFTLNSHFTLRSNPNPNPNAIKLKLNPNSNPTYLYPYPLFPEPF